ncbi:uncharacterized protein LOC114954260 [Acropora millepora]|uniref:uncharacterized protein LOC114954260 n=1 Tax=Acropora millepora TaxID=45264 RepID=UPI001CF54404|nr:uncharacterized protein LOC114954260 [Acropora millepora]
MSSKGNQEGFFGLYFAPLPNLEGLTAVKATIQTQNHDKINAIQPLCSRELIFTEPNVLVSPSQEERNQLFIVAQESVFQSCTFKELLQKLNILTTEQVDLTKSLFQFCMSFTLKQKLAPLWNKAGQFLVQGRDFMLQSSKLNAIALELNISDKVCLGLQAYSLKLQPCQPEHFTASTVALQRFHASKEAVICYAAISDDLCFVLPSLKRGRILNITHELPEDSPFKCYEDLRKHWKRMYGYRLPQEENVFYNVHFYYIQGKTFTYPASCIRSSQGMISARCDYQLIFSSFLRDLLSRMPAVCGKPLSLTSSPVYPTNRLQHASLTKHNNLTRTAPSMKHCIPFTVQHEQEKVMHANSPLGIEPATPVSSQSARIIPVFSKKKAQPPDHQVMDSVQRNKTVHTQDQEPKVTALSQVGIVGNSSKIQRWLAGANHSQTLFEEKTNSKYDVMMMRQDVSETVPNCHSEIVSSNPSSQGSVENDTFSILRSAPPQLNSTSSTPVTKRLPESRPGLIMMKRARPSNEVESFSCQATQDNRKKAEILPPRQGNHQFNLYGNTLGQAEISEHNLGMLSTSKEESRTEQFTKQTQANALASKKRQETDLLHGEPSKKKPRPKPRIQENLDVADLASKYQLRKVNLLTLAEWLKKRGVTVKSKEKKADLQSKVMQLLKQVPVHEQ